MGIDMKAYNKEYYQNNKYRILEKQKKWQENNKNYMNDYSKQYYLNNKQYFITWRENNKHNIHEYNKQYWKRNCCEQAYDVMIQHSNFSITFE